jgi:hypothetical protein
MAGRIGAPVINRRFRDEHAANKSFPFSSHLLSFRFIPPYQLPTLPVG